MIKKEVIIKFDDEIKEELNELIKNYLDPRPLIFDNSISVDECILNRDAFIRNKEKSDEMRTTIDKAITFIQNSYPLDVVLKEKETPSMRIDQSSWNLLSKAIVLFNRFTSNAYSHSEIRKEEVNRNN